MKTTKFTWANLNHPRTQAYMAVVFAAFMLAISTVSFFIALLGAFVLFSVNAKTIFPATGEQSALAKKVQSLDFIDLFAWLTIAMLSLSMLVAGPMPTGDLLRHITSSDWGMDVTQHYGNHSYPNQWSLWWGWERGIAWVYEATDRDVLLTSRICRSIMVTVVGTCLWLGFSRAGGKNKETAALCFSYTMVFLCWERLTLGKPDIVMLCAIGIAAYCTSRWVWLVVMVPFIPAHWLSAVIACSAFMLRTRSREDYIANMGAGFLFFCFAISFWFLLEGTDFFAIFAVTSTWLEMNKTSLDPANNISSTISLLNPLRLTALVFCTYAIVQAKDKFVESGKIRWEILCWLACPFLLALPDISTYLSAICTVLVLIGLRLYALVPIKAPILKICGTAAVMVSLYGCFQAFVPSAGQFNEMAYRTMPVLPEGARILTTLNDANNIAASRYPTAVIFPVFEPGAINGMMRDTVAQLNAGTVDCDRLTGLYHYVLENRLQGTPPACLSLMHTSGEYRLWQVVAANASQPS